MFKCNSLENTSAQLLKWTFISSCQLQEVANSLETFNWSLVLPDVPEYEGVELSWSTKDLLAVDIAILPWDDEEFRYFLCITKMFTRYAILELVPFPNQSTAWVSFSWDGFFGARRA